MKHIVRPSEASVLLPIMAVPLLPQETAVTGGSGSGGQLGVIVRDERLAPLLSPNKDIADI